MSFKRNVSNVTRRQAFTLIELLVTLAIIAVLASIVAPALFGNLADARVNTAKSQVQILTLALDSYRVDVGDYPTTEQGLQALRTVPPGVQPQQWKGPYLRQAIPSDPWGHPYVYESPGVESPESFDLFTFGKDGKSGGDGENADVTSWNGPIAHDR